MVSLKRLQGVRPQGVTMPSSSSEESGSRVMYFWGLQRPSVPPSGPLPRSWPQDTLSTYRRTFWYCLLIS